MNTLKRQFLLELFRIFDLGVAVFAFIAATIIAQRPGTIDTAQKIIDMRISVKNLMVLLLLSSAWYIILSAAGLYNSKRLSTFGREVKDIAKGAIFCVAATFIMNVLFPMNLANKYFLLLFGVALFGTLITSRIVLRFLLKQLRLRGANLRHVLIAGTNKQAIAFVEKITRMPELGLNFKGFIDSSWHKDAPTGERFTIVTDYDHLNSYLRENVIDEVIVCLPINDHYEQISSIIDACTEQGILVRVKTEFFKLKNAYPKVEYLDSDMLMTYATGHMRRRMLLLKKVLDFVIAFMLLAALSPILLAAAVAIKLTSPGPVFFIQERLGFNKRRFKLYKFRTMVPEAEKRIAELEQYNEVKGAAFKMKNDPRVTPIGRILRKLSIDELPQLFNVLKGDMSLVGPRPLPERDFRGFNIDWQRRRFCVKPGITCLWQVSGRNKLSFDEWMKLDLKYIDSWSPLLDFKILAKTVPAVFSGQGAS
jgi:exopolysaccharide biosynthesis polyprenyl glycosylphosphotransferase